MSERKPYPFQERVGELLLAGKSVVLQAPTGAGKTTAALLPFLHAWREETQENFPSKCVYTVPMRVLAHQFVHEYREVASSIQRRYRRSPSVQIQTGDQPDDRRFEGDLIFCTIDQFISSYLTMPYSLPNRLANLNAGAMVGTYLVFDEFHLLDPDSTLPSVLYTIKQLRQLAPVLLMTATFSTTMLDTLAREIDAQVVVVPPDEARRIETRDGQVAPRQRTWRTAETTLTPDVVLEMHRTRTLALCNTVQRAQSLYREIRDLIQARGLEITVRLLHSRFLQDDRRRTEEELRTWFGKEAEHGGSVIVVATQTIEVGVDITCEILHTELAPASSLIQRAGRCARYPGENGQVIVYPVENTRPYEGSHANEMTVALDWLQKQSGQVFDFAREQDFVNAVATPRDEKVLKGLSAGRGIREEDIHRVLRGDRQGQDARLLVRDADSRTVLIHSNPDALRKNPHGAIGFSLQPTSLYGFFKDWRERGSELDWQVKRLVEDTAKQADKNEDNRSTYHWDQVEDAKLLAAAQVLVVNPELAGYLTDEGFVADKGGTGFESTLPTDATTRTWEGFSYRLESYERHIELVLQAFQELALPELRYPARVLEQAARWDHGSVLHAAWLACLLHDVGKLDTGWQAWAQAYQAQVGNQMPKGFAAAHTDSEWGNPQHQAAEKAIRAKYPKPRHAGEGALATSAILNQALGRNELLVRATLMAIVRHHTPFAKECEVYELERDAQTHIGVTLDFVPQEVKARIDLKLLRIEQKTPPNSFHTLLARPEQNFGWLAYVLLARALRRADQEGTARGSKGHNKVS